VQDTAASRSRIQIHLPMRVSERERNLYSSAFFVSYNFYLRRDLERARENHERDRETIQRVREAERERERKREERNMK